MSLKSDFISLSRGLATSFVAASDTFNAYAARLNYSGFAALPEEGGLTNSDAENGIAGDFIGENADLTREDVLAFYQTLGVLLAPLTDEQKRSIYKLAR